MLKRRRVYQIAKDYRVSSEELLKLMADLGIEVTNHMSPLDEEHVASIKNHFEPPEPEEVIEETHVSSTDGDVSEPDSSNPESVPPDTTKSESIETVVTQAPVAEAVVVTDESETAVTETVVEEPPPALPQSEAQPAEEVKSPEGEKPETAQIQETTPKTESPPATDKPAEGSSDPKKPTRRVVINKERSSRPSSGRSSTPASRPPSAAQAGGDVGGKRNKKRKKRRQVNQQVVDANVQRTLAEMGKGRTRTRYDRGPQEDGSEEDIDPTVLSISEFTSVGEMADLMGIGSSEVIGQAMKMGLMVTLNQRLDMDTLTMLADEFGFQLEQVDAFAEAELEEDVLDSPEDMRPRPPVVTVMGHVDHGKTSLLDFIRRENVIAGESGGITQHIGAYHVQTPNGPVTFLDTPGHHTFTAMRARGAQMTDVVVLVVAADDGVMPQTIEAVDHARAASVPLVVAVNKIDLPDANPTRVKQELSAHNVIVEEYGGKVQSIEISAKRGDNMEELLELLALESGLLTLEANPSRPAQGTVVDARLDKGRGAVATILVQQGTLRVGDVFVSGLYAGRVRALLDERDTPIDEAGPGIPVQVLGFRDVPEAGDPFRVMASEREARDIAQKRQQVRREQEFRRANLVSLADVHSQISKGEMGYLPIIIKGDVAGSVEALCDAMDSLSTDEVAVTVIHSGTGAITESDVLLASASAAVIIGFHIRPEPRAREVAARERVEIRLYDVIYEVVDEVKQALSGLLSPEIVEKRTGEAEVREVFKVPRSGTIGGSMVRDGVIKRSDLVRVVRDGVVIYQGEVASLRRFKDDVREVQNGFECGIGVSNFNDIKVGDIMETFERIEVARTLE